MIRNVIIGQLKPDADPAALDEALAQLLGLHIDGAVLDMVCGPDLGLRPGNASFAVTVDLPDEQAYHRYDSDPEHERIRREHFAPICAWLHRVQFELP